MKRTPILLILSLVPGTLGAQARESKVDTRHLNKELCGAAQNGDRASAEAALQAGAVVDNRHCPKGYTPLMIAAREGQRAVVQLLLDADADPNVIVKPYSAVELAASQKHGEIVRLIVESGADLNLVYARSTMLKWVTSHMPELDSYLRNAQKVPPEARKARARKKSARHAEAEFESKRADIEEMERSGDAAVSRADPKAALAAYRKALGETPPGTRKDAELRGKVMKVARPMNPPPAIPEEARHHAERAQAFLKRAQDEAGFARGAEEMEKAAALAPWWPDAYFNLGVLQEKSKDYAGAVRSFKLYLEAAPRAPDAEAVRKKVVDLEVASELEGGTPVSNEEAARAEQPKPRKGK